MVRGRITTESLISYQVNSFRAWPFVDGVVDDSLFLLTEGKLFPANQYRTTILPGNVCYGQIRNLTHSHQGRDNVSSRLEFEAESKTKKNQPKIENKQHRVWQKQAPILIAIINCVIIGYFSKILLNIYDSCSVCSLVAEAAAASDSGRVSFVIHFWVCFLGLFSGIERIRAQWQNAGRGKVFHPGCMCVCMCWLDSIRKSDANRLSNNFWIISFQRGRIMYVCNCGFPWMNFEEGYRIRGT